MMISYIVTTQGITIIIPGERKPRYVQVDSRKKEIIELINDSNKNVPGAFDLLIKTISPVKYVATKHNELVIGDDNKLYLVNTERPIFGYLSKQLLEFVNEGLPVENLINFWKNCLENPKKDAVDELFDFLSANTYPITTDGCFIGYKKVYSTKQVDSDKFKGLRLDKQGNVRDSKGHFVGNPLRQEYIDFLENEQEEMFVDAHTRTIKQSIGSIVSMNREDCDSDRNRTCSRGLHVGSYEYSKDFSGDTFIYVKVNPKNVVAVPTDYNNGKLRCCEYEILGFAEESPLEIKVLD